MKKMSIPLIGLVVMLLATTAFGQSFDGWQAESLRGVFGSAICDSMITRSIWIGTPAHDTVFEEIKEIREKCDTLTDIKKVLASGPGYVTYAVTIKCSPDTLWGPREDLKLTKDDIALLLKFLRGKWTPPRDNNWYIPATTTFRAVQDTMTVRTL